MLPERPPLRRLNSDRWFNLILVVLALCYVAFTVATIGMRGLFDYIGVDYRSFYCTAKLIWQSGFDSAYNLERQAVCQRAIYDAYATGPFPGGYVTVPTPYLPPFLLPFLALLPLGPVPGLIFWTVLNAAGLFLYLRHFSRALQIQGTAHRAAVILSFATFMTFFPGQVNVWLLACLGEFLLAMRRGQEWRAGLWLGGWLLKPHFLPLLGLGLLIARRWKALAGLVLAGLGVLALSLLLAGPSGLLAVVQLVLRYPANLPSTAPEWMMNWRGLALNLGQLIPSPLAWGIAMTGLALTVGVALWLWRRAGQPTSASFTIAVLGTTAAACAVAWHSHTHSALVLAAPLLALQGSARLPRLVVNVWATGPALLYFLLQPAAPTLALIGSGLGMLAINVYLVAWSAWTIAKERNAAGKELP